jgi:biopolymer transport protein ExbD
VFRASLPRKRNLISLTPLIDVVFILLVFFMLASSFVHWRSIGLATPENGGGAAGLKGAMLVEILPDGLRFGTRAMTLEAFAGRVERRLLEDPAQRVLVRPAEGVALQRAVDVLDRLQAIGARNVVLIQAGRGGQGG